MFRKLRDKLKDWSKSFSKSKEDGSGDVEGEQGTTNQEVQDDSSTESRESQRELGHGHEEKAYETADNFRESSKNLNEAKSQEKEEKSREETGQMPKESPEDAQVSSEKPNQKNIFKRLTSGKVTITDKEFDEHSENLEMLLIENNVSLEVSEKIVESLRGKVVGKEVQKKNLDSEIMDAFRESIKEVLVEPFDLVEKIKGREDKSRPYVVMFCGINGTGKTTSIAKVAKALKDNGLNCLMAASDTFRAASVEQIQKHGRSLGVEVVSNDYGSDPASVAYDAISSASSKGLDCVLIDTAGRMHTEKNLMSQIEKVSRVSKPDLNVFVGEATTGNDIVEQVEAFDNSVGIGGIVLSKADIDENGGAALSVGHVTGNPILYLGTGQNYEDLEKFSKDALIEKLGV